MQQAINSETPRVLVADDQMHVREALQMLLSAEGFHTLSVSSPDNVMAALAAQPFDLVLMDLNYARDTTSGREGLDLVERIRSVDSNLPLVAMTGWATIDLTVTAMKTGFCDFILKPWDNGKLIETIKREVRNGRVKRRAARDVAEARHIQQTLLPRTLPTLRGWNIAADWKPANDVGGDYFDVIPLSDTRLGICMADVAGKGLSAALLMSNLQGLLRTVARDSVAPSEVCARLNRMLCKVLDGGRFVTLFYGVLDAGSRAFTWCNAGHNPALLHQRGASSWLSDGGIVLGLIPDASFTEQWVRIDAAARLLLYTDGITEAEDEFGMPFGEDRLIASLAQHRDATAAAIRDRLFASVSGFCHGRFRDDAALMVVAAD
jgi:sigma-B regulation protein RsbU (phosphoserine phosphatase)